MTDYQFTPGTGGKSAGLNAEGSKLAMRSAARPGAWIRMVLGYLKQMVLEAVVPELLKDGTDRADCDTAEPVWVWEGENGRAGRPGQPQPSGPPAGGSGPVSPPNRPQFR